MYTHTDIVCGAPRSNATIERHSTKLLCKISITIFLYFYLDRLFFNILTQPFHRFCFAGQQLALHDTILHAEFWLDLNVGYLQLQLFSMHQA